MYGSWSFTIRPRNGFPEELDDKVIAYCKKQTGGFLCSEMDAEARHLHGQLFFKEPRDKGTVNRSLERLCANNIPEWDGAQSIVLRRGTKIAYSDDFITEYLSKEDNILFNNVPLDTKPFYPSLEEQTKVKNKSDAVDKKYHQWSVDFNEWNSDEPITLELVAKFLSYKIYEEKRYPVIAEKRKRVEATQNLYNYLRPGKNTYYQFLSNDKVSQIQMAEEILSDKELTSQHAIIESQFS